MTPSSRPTKVALSKLARRIVHETIPDVIRASPRARAGIASVRLFRDEAIVPVVPTHLDAPPPKIRVVSDDTLNAAHDLVSTPTPGRVIILSMASELRPGGGFMNGASAQEESLCMRTTLYPSLRDEFYRLPDLGCIYTPDVCVFSGCYGDEHPQAERPSSHPFVGALSRWWFVDVISCAAVRGPDVDAEGKYEDSAQKDMMREKIKRVLRVAVMTGGRRLVLGAFGCGAFENPSKEVAELFHRVILGRDGSGTGSRGGEFVGCFDEIVFAIKGGKRDTLANFQAVFPDQ